MGLGLSRYLLHRLSCEDQPHAPSRQSSVLLESSRGGAGRLSVGPKQLSTHGTIIHDSAAITRSSPGREVSTHRERGSPHTKTYTYTPQEKPRRTKIGRRGASIGSGGGAPSALPLRPAAPLITQSHTRLFLVASPLLHGGCSNTHRPSSWGGVLLLLLLLLLFLITQHSSRIMDLRGRRSPPPRPSRSKLVEVEELQQQQQCPRSRRDCA